MKRSKKIKIKLLFVLLFLILTAIYVLSIANRVIISIAEETMKSNCVIAVNEAVFITLKEGINYEDVISIIRDENGNVISITTNPLNVNRIARDTAYLSQNNLKKLNENGVLVPLGAFTGIEFLAGVGKEINIKIIPINNVSCEFISRFKEAGINQTKHSVFLKTIANVSVVTPFKVSCVSTVVEVLICENIINGKVPQIYLKGN